MVNGKQVPIGVRVISILYYIAAVLCALFAILLMIGAGFIGSVTNQIPIIGALGAGLFIIAGIIIFGFGIFGFFIGRGLWKAKAWARIIAVVLSCIGIVSALVSMIQGNIANNIVGLIISGVVGGYLMFNSSVKKAFT